MLGLYNTSFESEKMEAVIRARQRAERLSDDQVLAFDGNAPDDLAQQSKMVFAELKPECRRGKRINGQIEVSIPFEGFPKTFLIQPSRSRMIRVPATYDGDGIKAFFPDDDNLDKNVNLFIEAININTENLKTDWPTLVAEAKNSFEQSVMLRKKALEAQKERDRKVSFPID